MKVLLTALILSLSLMTYNKEAKANWEVGHIAAAGFGCSYLEAIEKLAEGDATDKNTAGITWRILVQTGICGNFISKGQAVKIPAVVKEVIRRYKDYNGKSVEIVRVWFQNNKDREFFTLLYVDEAKSAKKIGLTI